LNVRRISIQSFADALSYNITSLPMYQEFIFWIGEGKEEGERRKGEE
jgi:hypothetical protein